MKLKYIGRSSGVAGLILIILGIIFTLQSRRIVGPSSSFMFSNPDWTVNGSVVIGAGVFIFVLGIILWRISSE
ncbi:MAG: hypothetical protein M3P08_14695 [Thermoproteota archaeon]|jgi:hypothetical protein|nr:hypothetical protein [Thermoproteota archaeon]